MNDFTKEELEDIHFYLYPGASECASERTALQNKIQSMINDYDNKFKNKECAKSHLDEAENLILHAKCLLGMDDE